jgi:hypothetical protein
MSKFLIRFNRNRGKPGRGSVDHVWRVFEGEKEYLVKNFRLDVPSWGKKSMTGEGEDWNVACEGVLEIDRETSTAIIKASP